MFIYSIGGIFLETENQNAASSSLGKDRKFTLTPKMYKFAITSLCLGTILFLGACGYSVYSFLNYRNNQAEIVEMQQSTELQQEQLLNLSKKATNLSEELQNLTQMETELRIQAGVKPPKDVEEKKAEAESAATNETAPAEDVATQDSTASEPTTSEPPAAETSEEEYDGQGGPIDELKLNDLEEALTILETNLKTRRESLEDLQAALKAQREQMAMMISVQAATQSATSPAAAISASGPMSTNAFAFGTSTAGSNVPSIWPTTGVVTSPYGLRWGGSDFHPGMDIANDLGTPVVATADGVVEYAGWNSGGYGNMVDINHGNGIMTRYGHGSQVLVSAGQHVSRGQVIMLMGSTGFSTGPHVHYEVHVNGQRVNPISYL